MAIRWTSKRIPGDRNDKDEASIEFEGTRGEIDALDNALSTGQLWVRKDEAGNLIFAPSFKKPELGTDYDVEPYFTKGKKIARLARGLLKKDETDRSDCSVFAQHICGYGGNYEERARRLENAGFSCLRSRRGKDGKYWEIWYLPGLWAYEGPTAKKKKKTKKDVINFLANIGVCQFAISHEHWGASIE